MRGVAVVVNRRETVFFRAHNEACRCSCATGATRSTNSMHMNLGICAEFEIDHEVEFVNVEAASGYICRHKYRRALVRKLNQRAVALILFHVAVQRRGMEFFFPEIVFKLLALMFLVAEDERRLGLMQGEKAEDHLQPIYAIDFVKTLLYLRIGGIGFDTYVYRVSLEICT